MAKPKRIGVLVPSTNQTVEPDFNSVVPKGVTVLAEQIIGQPSQEGKRDNSHLIKMNEDIERGCQYLREADLNLIVYAYTSGTYREGR